MTFLKLEGCCPFKNPRFFPGLRSRSDAGSGLRLLGVTGGGGRGLSGECVHCAEELICDASGFPEAAEQGAVDCSGVISDGVFAGEEQTRDGLEEKKQKQTSFL